MQLPLIARGGQPPGRFTSAYSATIAAIALLCIIVVSHDLYRTLEDRYRRIADSQLQVANLALAAERQAGDAFGLAAGSLAELVHRIETDGIGPAQRERLQGLMQEQIASVQVLDSLHAVDESGAFIADSRPPSAEANIVEREFFKYHLTHPSRLPYINQVLRSHVTGQFVVVISRRADHPDGTFAGVVMATISMQYFQDFYATIDLGHDGVLALFRDDSTNIVRQPPIEGATGLPLAHPAPFLSSGAQIRSGVFEGRSPVDGVERIYAWRRIPDFPLIVLVGLGKDEQLAGWRLSAGEHLLAAFVAAMLLGIIGVRLVYQVRQLAEAERAAAAASLQAQSAAADYRLLADNTSDMVVLLDMQFRRRYVSPSTGDLLGYEPEELLGGTPPDQAHPDDREPYLAHLKALASGHGPDRDRLTYRVGHRDGRWIWMETLLTLVRDPVTGAPQRICGSGRDITEQVEAVAAMRQSEERLRLVLQSHAIAEALYLLDPTGAIESWSAGAERIMGYRPEEIIGKNFALFFRPEDVDNGEPARALAVASQSGTVAFEAWRVRKDGNLFLAEVVIDAIRNPDGTLRGFVKVTRDTTDRRIEEEQRRIIVESAPNGILIVDEAGLITLANSQVEKIFDYPAGALLGEKVEILVPEALRAPHVDLRSNFTSGRSDQPMSSIRQFTGRKRNGDPVPIEILLRPVKTPRGRIVVAALFDVTERLRLEALREAEEQREREATAAANASLERLARHLARARDRAEQANRAKSRFLAGMSHELRTPLNGILGYAHLLGAEGDLNPAQAARVDAMKQAGKHLLEMITCVLDLSEIEADHLALRPVEIDLPSIASACLDLIRPMAEAKGLGLAMTIAPAMPAKLTADPTRLRQILLNLLGNAAKFTAHGSVGLSMRPIANGKTLRIDVADTGPGVRADQRDRLFREFERLDADAALPVEGAGLGLVLSARLAVLMGGRIGHEDNPGGGSVFWLELPLSRPEPPLDGATGADPPPQAASPAVGACHVLVVDDVLMNRDIASSFLRMGGHTVTSVESGPEAVAAAEQTDFDVILMDVRMPGMDGLEATRRIRARGGVRGSVPIVALTAQAFTDQIAACRAAGMDSHLAKPFEPETLLAAVTEAVTAGRRAVEKADLAGDGAVAGVEIAVLNNAAFDRTTSFLPPETAAAYMRTILELSDSLLRRLRLPDALTHYGDDLADQAHSLSGSAGMFGFARLAAVGRSFEHAVRSGSADVAPLAEALVAALEATVAEIHAMSAADPVP